MLNLILTLAMSTFHPAAMTAQFQPCVWPNKCAETPAAAPVQTAQFQPCVWPNKCAAPVAQVQTCVWPHTCREQA